MYPVAIPLMPEENGKSMTSNMTPADSFIEPLIQAALRAVEPYKAISRHVQREGDTLVVDNARYDLHGKDVRLIAVGKAAVPMARSVCQLLGNQLSRGVVVTKYGHTPPEHRLPLSVIELIEAGHPVPDKKSMRAGNQVCDRLTGCTENTLVIVCVSGGASALIIAPHAGISLNTMRAINDALLSSGADIREMNAVRSRLDRLKGGGLVRMASPAQVIGLILSDVIGDPLDVIASGITNDSRAHNILVGNNTQACEAVANTASEMGCEPRIITTSLRGEAREQGQRIAQELFSSPRSSADGSEVGVRQVLIYGGETTVTIRGTGKGGRNQELALSAAIELERMGAAEDPREMYIVAIGTDGTDGPTDAAGAIARSNTVRRARQLGMDAQAYLNRNDSYPFFQEIGDLLRTNPTGTNVADIVIAIVGQKVAVRPARHLDQLGTRG